MIILILLPDGADAILRSVGLDKSERTAVSAHIAVTAVRPRHEAAVAVMPMMMVVVIVVTH